MVQMRKHLTTKNILRTLAILGGAAAGYAYYYFVGCYNGSCAIQSNPWFSTFYGAFIVAVLVIPVKKKSSPQT